jgi:hypothetical protein
MGFTIHPALAGLKMEGLKQSLCQTLAGSQLTGEADMSRPD